MNSNLFFFDQTGIRKRAKRQKKTPDELPQSLRFAHLNPRIAAFLRQQERARARAGEGDDHTPREGDGSNPTADGANIINLRDLKAGIGIGRGDGFFLPDIKDGSFSLPLLRTGYFDNNSNDGEEFTQRHLYQEAIFAAPMLLIQLGRILYLFRNEHLDLPRELVNLLLNSWIELISETQYTTREWQSQAYQEKAMNKIEEEEREKEQKDKEIKEAAEAEEAEKEKKKKKKKRADDDDESKKGMVDTSDGAPAILQYRKESKAPSVGSTPLKPKTRLERFKSMHRLEVPEARKSGRKVGGIDLQSNTTESHSEVAAQVSNREQPSFLQVINFTLSSRLAEERGWIIHPDEKDDLERQTIIEWASQRLQLCIKQT
ncbi:uncharacterized protein LOC102801331 [Saccoglossus kowalevskii]|uniref:Uncharacterized protein LOC102801331 n=1 Tax=Saccoglossus kowalevskii TaxID=10224 RepID=A0ABM0MIJ6_SACKO|nr:PREDICTED: uncharacterized protein LOC102801331 [Saccoglossus kowalevskii]